ncbi:nucleotidyltransferase family protein [Spirosoma sp. KUDC1026]|uniref:nucleotidyltransferase family protein n=1 Tax=Spirosoma sp. KUDC1026 TaxID=2745947 RepID=UPI00159BE094|nr:nucleotidyltransferase domain-containing protein [Spirosoma sp. KUDC1026]QKZ11425.1 nucleotidyltransferase domain-containing protein [Spirosoma sp. KUDC1026]
MKATAITRDYILETLRANQERLRNEFGIERIGLYGSFARNEQNEKSDIDLVYHLQDGRFLDLPARERLYRVLRRNLGQKLDLVNDKVMNPFISYYMRKDVIYV